ncbi:hypothetical protein AVEN_42129-1 [Araneus ventricosus]|uniref:Uncharacterized protein n=1 Tax=Araneus ventricosus TaxID=182803 RepID=A0A4Y2D5P1_ARAVE|nr:hypothetical protein AVEN_42129-1 [Araneus ventricosus]
MWLVQKGRLLFLEVGAGNKDFLEFAAVFEGRSEFPLSLKQEAFKYCVNKLDREDFTARKRRLARERFARWRARQSQETLNRMRAADNEYLRRRKEGESQEESAKMPCTFFRIR